MAAVDPGLLAVLVISVFFVVWFFAGSAMNRRLARKLSNELRDAVLRLGGESRIQWLGSSAFRITTRGADPPFRDVSVIVTLRPREMPINWAIGRAVGRGDRAVVDASLAAAPTVDLELVDPRTSVGRRRAASSQEWSRWTFRGRQVLVASEDEDTARALLEGLPEGAGSLVAVRIVTGADATLAASLDLVPGRVGHAIEALRGLAQAATA